MLHMAGTRSRTSPNTPPPHSTRVRPHMAPTSLLSAPVPQAYATGARVPPLMTSGHRRQVHGSSPFPPSPSHPALWSRVLREIALCLLSSRLCLNPWNWLVPQAYPTSSQPTPDRLAFPDPSTSRCTHPWHFNHHGMFSNGLETGSPRERSMACARPRARARARPRRRCHALDETYEAE
jgi:hypothetical protein